MINTQKNKVVFRFITYTNYEQELHDVLFMVHSKIFILYKSLIFDSLCDQYKQSMINIYF